MCFAVDSYLIYSISENSAPRSARPSTNVDLEEITSNAITPLNRDRFRRLRNRVFSLIVNVVIIYFSKIVFHTEMNYGNILKRGTENYIHIIPKSSKQTNALILLHGPLELDYNNNFQRWLGEERWELVTIISTP